MSTIEEYLTQPDGLAAQLHQLRREAHLTGSALGRLIGLTQYKVSRLENGKQLPTAGEIDRWTQACGGGEDARAQLQALLTEAYEVSREWRRRARLGTAALQRGHREMAQQAVRIRNAETVMVPGLLQIRDYARWRLAEHVAMHDGPDREAELDAGVTERLHRQEILHDARRSFEFVITEAALYLLLCPAAVMRSQIDRLVALTFGLSNITFGIIPFGVPLPVNPQHGFILYDDVAVVETIAAEIIPSRTEAEVYHTTMDRLLAAAVFGPDARELLLGALNTLVAS